MTKPLDGTHKGYQARIKSSDEWVRFAAEWLRSRGWHVFVPELRFTDDYEDRMSCVDDGDLFVENKGRVEVKHQSNDYDSIESHQWPNAIVDEMRKWESYNPKPYAYILINKAGKGCLICESKYSNKWVSMMLMDYARGKKVEFVLCPIEYAVYMDIYNERERMTMTVKQPNLPGFLPKSRKTATKPRDETFETLARLWCGGHARLTKSERGVLNDATKQLKDVGADCAQIQSAWTNMGLEWPNAECTPSSLVKHWNRFQVRKKTNAPNVAPDSEYQDRKREEVDQAEQAKIQQEQADVYCRSWSERDPLGYSDARAEFLAGANSYLGPRCQRDDGFFRWNLWDKHGRALKEYDPGPGAPDDDNPF